MSGGIDAVLMACPLTEHACQVLKAFPRRHLPHYLLHLTELIQELIDVLRRRAAAFGDATPAAATYDLRAATLLRRHRVDNRLHLLDLVFAQFALGNAARNG